MILSSNSSWLRPIEFEGMLKYYISIINIYMTKYSRNILNILQKYSPHIMTIFSTVFIIVSILILCDVVIIVFPFL